VDEYSTVFVGMDVAKERHAVAVAEPGRQGEVRYFGEVNADAASVRKLVARLEKRHGKLHFCYEAGPTGYRLYRQIIPEALAFDTRPFSCPDGNDAFRVVDQEQPCLFAGFQHRFVAVPHEAA